MVCAMLRCSTLRICRLVGALELHSQCHQCVTCLLILGEESFFFLLCTIAMQHHFVLGSYSSYTLFFPNIYTCIHIIILSLQCGWVEKCFGWVVYRWLHPTYFMKSHFYSPNWSEGLKLEIVTRSIIWAVGWIIIFHVHENGSDLPK